MRRRRRILDTAKVLGLLAALALVALWLSGTSRDGPARAPQAAPSQAETAEALVGSDGGGEAASGLPAAGAPVAPAEARGEPDPALAAELADPSRNPELKAAILAALQSGGSRTWQYGNHFGMVIVDDPKMLGGQVCRKYWFTLTAAGAGSSSHSGQACRDDPSSAWNIN